MAQVPMHLETGEHYDSTATYAWNEALRCGEEAPLSPEERELRRTLSCLDMGEQWVKLNGDTMSVKTSHTTS